MSVSHFQVTKRNEDSSLMQLREQVCTLNQSMEKAIISHFSLRVGSMCLLYFEIQFNPNLEGFEIE